MNSKIKTESSRRLSDDNERLKHLQIHGKRFDHLQETQYLKHLDEEKQNKERLEQQEKQKNYQQLLQYNPWGKPGGGAPMEMLKKQKLMEILINPKEQSSDVVDTFFTFGKPGHGAPQKTKSGRLRTQIRGDPSIRFHEAQNVHKSVENGIRYFEGHEAQQEYRKALDTLIKERADIMKQEMELKKELELQHEKAYPFGRVSNGLPRPMPMPDPVFSTTRSSNLHPYPIHKNRNNSNNHLYDPWGKGFGTPVRDQFGNAIRLSPRWQSSAKTDDDKLEGLSIPLGKYCGGDGSPHFKDDSGVITKLQRTLNKEGVKDFNSNEDSAFQNSSHDLSPGTRKRRTFLEKLGWKEDLETSEEIERGKRLYLQYLKGAMDEANTVKKDQQNAAKEQSKEMAFLMREKKVGCPSRHSITGFISDDHKMRATDVTNRSTQSYSEEYKKTLAQQAEDRYLKTQKLKELELLETQKHFEAWDSLWQRPGHGAPKDPINHRKEGLSFLCKPIKKVQK